MISGDDSVLEEVAKVIRELDQPGQVIDGDPLEDGKGVETDVAVDDTTPGAGNVVSSGTRQNLGPPDLVRVGLPAYV